MKTTPSTQFRNSMFGMSLTPFRGADLLAAIQFNNAAESDRLARECGRAKFRRTLDLAFCHDSTLEKISFRKYDVTMKLSIRHKAEIALVLSLGATTLSLAMVSDLMWQREQAVVSVVFGLNTLVTFVLMMLSIGMFNSDG